MVQSRQFIIVRLHLCWDDFHDQVIPLGHQSIVLLLNLFVGQLVHFVFKEGIIISNKILSTDLFPHFETRPFTGRIRVLIFTLVVIFPKFGFGRNLRYLVNVFGNLEGQYLAFHSPMSAVVILHRFCRIRR